MKSASKMKLTSVLLFAASLLLGHVAWGEFVIAERGQDASCPIVVPESPSACVQYAAEELRDYTERMTGVRLAIETNTAPARAVRLGVRETGLGSEGFRISADEQGVRICVSEGIGVGALYGVYELLETYGGVGWFSSWTTIVPTLDRFAVPLRTDVLQKPAFVVRQPFFWDVNSHPEFGAKLRRNCWSWCGKIPEKLGGDRFRSGAGLYGHSFSILLPPEKYFKDHPEYFSEVRGKRLGRNSQLCLTNPDVFRIVASNLLAAIRRDPGGYRYAVTHNDNQNYCTCAKCRAVCEEEGSPVGPDIRFVNALADLVAKEFPGKILSTSAYQYTCKPPRTAPRPNVNVSLCPIECEHSLPLDESPCEKNRRFVENMRGWARLTRNLGVFDYVANFENYLGPYPDVYSLQGNLRFFRDNGVWSVYEEGDHCGGHGDFSELKAWLLGKWLWDPELPVGPLLDRFFNGYYGKAAPVVRTYFDELHTLQRDAAVHPLYTYTDYFDPAISDEFLSRALSLWKKAERLVADDPVRAYNVRMGEMSVAYMILRRGEKRIAVSREEYPSADLRRLAAWMLERVAEAGTNGISRVANRGVCFFEGGYAPSRGDKDAKMCAKWRRITDPSFALPPADRAVCEIEDVFDSYPGIGCRVVDDPAASGGKSMLVPLYRPADWMLHMTMRAFKGDRGTTYRLRLRVRAELKPGAPEVGVFSAGIHGACSREFTTSQVSGEYRWYDIGTFRDIGADRMMFIARGIYDAKKYGGNPASDNVWVDQIEIVVEETSRPEEPPFQIIRLSARETNNQAKWCEAFSAITANVGCCDELWFSTGIGFPSLETHRHNASIQAKAAEECRGAGIRPGLEIQATLGHSDLPDIDLSGRNWRGWTGSDGREATKCNCPRDPRLAEYFEEVGRIYAAWKPSSIWLDDDLRLNNHRPVTDGSIVGCWCERCVGDFSAIEGLAWTRENLTRAMAADPELLNRWETFSFGSLSNLAGRIAAAVHEVSPETRMGYQHGLWRNGKQSAIYRALYDATGLKVGSRPGGGAYYDHNPYAQIGKAYEAMLQKEMLSGAAEVIGQMCEEVESWPRKFSCRTPQGVLLESIESLALGMDSVSYFISDSRYEKMSWYGNRFFRVLAANRACLKGYADANRGTLPTGLLYAGEAADAEAPIPPETVSCAGVPLIVGAGVSFGTYAEFRRRNGDRDIDMTAASSSDFLAWYRLADEVSGGRMPVVLETPLQALIVPRVDERGILKTVLAVNTTIDASEPATLRVRNVPDGKVRWHALHGDVLDVGLVRRNGEVVVALPSLSAWNAGWLEFGLHEE